MARGGMSFEIKGMRELEWSLSALGDESTKVGRSSLRTTANEVRDVLITTAPRSDRASTGRWRQTKRRGRVGYDYGHLFENIKVREQKAWKDHLIVMAVTVGAAFWGAFRELGTRHQPPRPWMRPVFETMAPSLLPRLEKVLKKRIEAAARRLARQAAKKAGR